MTDAQARVFSAIKALISRLGHSPTYREIGRVAQLSSLSVIHKHIKSLERDGYIVRSHQNRGIAISLDKVLHGFRRCQERHDTIFFKGSRCPLCVALNRTMPPREVSKVSTFPSS